MTPAEIEQARRWVACKGFRWMPGMRIVGARQAGRVLDGSADYATWYGEGCTRDGGGHHEQCPVDADRLPDITDPAFLGCAWSMVEATYGPDVTLIRFATHVRRATGDLSEPALWWALADAVGIPLTYAGVDEAVPFYHKHFAAPTKLEALLLAMEGAP